MPLRPHGLALAVVGAGRVAIAIGRKRLLEGRGQHPRRLEHLFPHELGERPASRIGQGLLHDGRASTGILLTGPGRSLHEHASHVRQLMAVEDLDDGRELRVRVVPREAEPIAQAGRVTGERTRRHRTVPGELTTV